MRRETEGSEFIEEQNDPVVSKKRVKQKPFPAILSFRNNTLSVSQNQFDLTKLTHPIKYLFLNSYLLCNSQKCLNFVFKPSEHKLKREDKISVSLTDNEAVHIIWRMQTALQTFTRAREIDSFAKELDHSVKQSDYYKEMAKKLEEVKQRFLHVRASNYTQRKKIEESIMKLNEAETKSHQKIQKFQKEATETRAKLSQLQKRQNKRMVTAQMNDYMKKTIRYTARELLTESIVVIIELDDGRFDIMGVDYVVEVEEVYVVFEQSYGIKKMLKAALIRHIGSDTYLEKVKIYQDMKEKAKRYLLSSNDFLCCHRCLEIQPADKLTFCHKKITAKENASFVNTDYLYYKYNRIDGDYFNKPEGKHVIPYFQYLPDDEGVLQCNRGFCENCLVNHFHQTPETFNCLFCNGVCNCRRCEKANTLVKLIAHDISNGQDVRKQNYMELLKYFSNIKNSNIRQILSIIPNYKTVEFVDKSLVDSSRSTLVPLKIVKRSEAASMGKTLKNIASYHLKNLVQATKKAINPSNLKAKEVIDPVVSVQPIKKPELEKRVLRSTKNEKSEEQIKKI